MYICIYIYAYLFDCIFRAWSLSHSCVRKSSAKFYPWIKAIRLSCIHHIYVCDEWIHSHKKTHVRIYIYVYIYQYIYVYKHITGSFHQSHARRSEAQVFSWIEATSVVLQPTATHCNTLQHTATHCTQLQHNTNLKRKFTFGLRRRPRCWFICKTLHYTTTHCNALQHTSAHCNTLHHTATHCNTLQHIATNCNTTRIWRASLVLHWGDVRGTV